MWCKYTVETCACNLKPSYVCTKHVENRYFNVVDTNMIFFLNLCFFSNLIKPNLDSYASFKWFYSTIYFLCS